MYRACREDDQLQQAMRARESPSAKRRCVLSLEAASGSTDVPRVVHTLALDVPTNGDAVTLLIRATMEPAPEDVSTQRVDSPGREPNPAAPVTALVDNASGTGADGPVSMGAATSGVQALEFSDMRTAVHRGGPRLDGTFAFRNADSQLRRAKGRKKGVQTKKP